MSAAALLLTMAAPSYSWADARFLDPMNTPAIFRTHVERRPLMAVAHAGARLVAVGSRGLIILSDDEGKTWNQVSVPVQSDLLAVQFPTPLQGWACGHDGVILHTSDGGRSWVKQLDGDVAKRVFTAFYQGPAQGNEGVWQAAHDNTVRNFQAGASLPFLDIYFLDENRGFAVGSFGMLAATRDGGKTWLPWMHLIDNPDYLNLNAIRSINGTLYVVGEHGSVFQLDGTQSHFSRTTTGYDGSFFGIVGDQATLLAFGLRGTIYRSLDHGMKWEALAVPSSATFTAAQALPAGEGFVLADDAGQFFIGGQDSQPLRSAAIDAPMLFTSVAVLDASTLVATGLQGVRLESLNRNGR